MLKTVSIQLLLSQMLITSKLDQKLRALFCVLVVCTVCTSHNHSELHKLADTVNAASSSQGAVAFAWFSQETFDAHFAIDEVVSETQKG